MKVISRVLDDRSRLDNQDHHEQHQWLAEYIEHERSSRLFREAIMKQVFGWGIIAIIGTIGTIVARKFGLDL